MIVLQGLGIITIADLEAAITRFENNPGANNNPGNLRAGPGQIGTDANGFAIFPDLATGRAALDHQIQLNIDRGLSLEEFFGGKPGVYAGYAPAADKNNPGLYADTVAGWLDIDPTVPLSQQIGSTSSNSAFPALLSDSGDSPLSLDLFDASGLSWPLLAGVAGGILLLSLAVSR